MEELTVDVDAAVEFLREITPADTFGNVTAIDGFSGECMGVGFRGDSLERARAFITANNSLNLYWTVNTPSACIDQKPAKRDIAYMRYAHLDLDDPSEDALERIRRASPPPTLIIFSGGGYGAFWQLAEPVAINGNLDELEVVNRRIIEVFQAGKGTWNIDRLMRLPWTVNRLSAKKMREGRQPAATYVVEHHPDRVYGLEELGAITVSGSPTATLENVSRSRSGRLEGGSSERDTAFAGPDRSRDLLHRVAMDVRAGKPDHEILALHRDHPHARDQSDPDRAVRRCIDRARTDLAMRPTRDASERPSWMSEGSFDEYPCDDRANGNAAERHVIQLAAGQFHVSAEAAEQLITGEIYVRARQLARIGTAPELTASLKADISRDQDQHVIVPVSAEYLRRRLNTLAEFQKYSRREKTWFPVDCPGDLVSNILGYGEWQHFRPLEGIATAPFLRPDLTVCATPGYDATSRVFYAPTAAYPPIPESPNKDDAEGALERLLHPFRQFPYATDAARAAYLTNVLTAVARHAIDVRPIYVYTAPVAATGKTLLAKMASLIADGVEPAVKPYTDEAEELRKVLLTVLIAGDPTLLLDNVPSGSKVRSATLCAFSTAAVYGDRKLGASESLKFPNRCQPLLTGNNVSPAGDLARRCIVIRLDANAETARGRDFEIADLRAHVVRRRPQLLVDALTVLRAYALASEPVKLRPLESYERWSRIARDPVVWLGYGDAVETQPGETDDELGPLVVAFKALAGREQFFWPKQFSASDIATACNGIGGEGLRHAIQSAGCSEAASAKHISYWLREHRDRVAGDYKLTNEGVTHGVTRWCLKGTK